MIYKLISMPNPPDGITPQKMGSGRQFTIYGGSLAESRQVEAIAHVSYALHITNNG
jgi:hypothetical protein